MSLHGLRLPRLIATVLIVATVSLGLLRCAFAGDAAATRPGVAITDRQVIWDVPIDRVGAMCVGVDTIVIAGRDTARDKGRCMGLSKATGKTLWSVTHDPLPQRVHDMAATITSTPFIDHDRVYYVSNRGELCCLRLADGHVVWMLDMPAKLGVFKTDPGDLVSQAPSPVVVGDIVYCTTGNGVDVQRNVPAPDAPSFIAVNKMSGQVLWSSSAPGKNISYGQWSTPALATVHGSPQTLFPGGDGSLYSFEPISGMQLWKVNCRGPDIGKYYYRGEFIAAPPLVVGQTAYVSPGLDCEGAALGRHLLAIDLPTHAILWNVAPDGYSATMGPMAFSDGAVYAAGILGTVVAVDAKTGAARWTRRLADDSSSILNTGGICLHGNRLYLVTEDGDLVGMSTKTGETIDTHNFNDAGVGTPVVEGDRIFFCTRGHVFALRLLGN